MASLSARSLNALRGGYSGIDPDAASIFGLGVASSGVDLKRLKEQLAFQQQQFEESKQRFSNQAALSLIGRGFGEETDRAPRTQAEKAIFDITGKSLSAPSVIDPNTAGQGTTGFRTRPSSANARNLISLGPGRGSFVDTRDRTDTGRPFMTARPFQLGKHENAITLSNKLDERIRRRNAPKFQGGSFLNLPESASSTFVNR